MGWFKSIAAFLAGIGAWLGYRATAKPKETKVRHYDEVRKLQTERQAILVKINKELEKDEPDKTKLLQYSNELGATERLIKDAKNRAKIYNS